MVRSQDLQCAPRGCVGSERSSLDRPGDGAPGAVSTSRRALSMVQLDLAWTMAGESPKCSEETKQSFVAAGWSLVYMARLLLPPQGPRGHWWDLQYMLGTSGFRRPGGHFFLLMPAYACLCLKLVVALLVLRKSREDTQGKVPRSLGRPETPAQRRPPALETIRYV